MQRVVVRKGTEETSRSEEEFHAETSTVDAVVDPSDPVIATLLTPETSRTKRQAKVKSKLALLSSNVSPSSATVPESEDEAEQPSPCSALGSLYFASPLTGTAILEEDEDPDIPSDEEDSVYETNHVPMDEAAGSLRKLQAASALPALPVKLDEPSLPGAKQSVSDDALAYFKQLKLHAKIQSKSQKKKRKQSKLQERLQEDQTNRQLWAAYQELEQDVSSIDSGRDKIITASSVQQQQPLHEMYFDFESVDFSLDHIDQQGGDENGSLCSQSNLSLLSEQSLDAQRKYYAEKKKQKKKKKKSRKHSSSEAMLASKSSVGGSVASFGSKDYGPPRFNPAARAEVALLPNMEVMVPDMETSEPHEMDNASYVSDLGDESTLGSNASSFNDYGVSRRRRHRLPASRPSKSLKSKLDSLENAVAELRGSKTLSEAAIATSGQELRESVQLGEPWKMWPKAAAVPPEEQSSPAEQFKLQILKVAEGPVAMDAPLQCDYLQAVHETSYTTEDEAIPNILEKYDTTPCRIGSKIASVDNDSSKAVSLVDASANQDATEIVPTSKLISIDNDPKEAVSLADASANQAATEIVPTLKLASADDGSTNAAPLQDTSANQIATEIVPSTEDDEKVLPTNDAIKSSPLVERSCKADTSELASSDCNSVGGQVRRQVDSRAQLFSGKSIHSLTTEEFRLLSFVFDSPPSDEDSLSPSRGEEPIEETVEPDPPIGEAVEDEEPLSPSRGEEPVGETAEPDPPIEEAAKDEESLSPSRGDQPEATSEPDHTIEEAVEPPSDLGGPEEGEASSS